MAVRVLGVVLWGLLVTVAAVDIGVRVAPDRPQCSPLVGDRCVEGDYSLNEYYYTINGMRDLISFSEGSYYTARCEAASLGDAALPAFARRKRFPRVTLSACAPPPAGSYADALAALNVTDYDRLTLKGLPKDTHLTAASFVGLSSLKSLELSTYSPSGEVMVLEAGVFEPLGELESLGLVGVRPLGLLPPRLDALRLRETGFTALPPEALNVVTLEVVEANLTELGPAPRLQTLTLQAPVLAPPPAPALRRASLSRWAAPAPAPLPAEACARLEELALQSLAAAALPPAFVAACPALRALELMLMQAKEIPLGFLRNASALTSFKAANWPLATLPPDLFEYSPLLRDIDLSNNGLESLPSGIFTPVVGSLRTLSLARNRLHAVDALTVAPLSELRVLNLSNNLLGDLCPATSSLIVARSVSYLSGLQLLQQLVLSRTGATRVCADWTHHMPALGRLDLTHNRIAELQFADLKIQRKVSPADVDLSGNPLHKIHCSREDYELAADDAIPSQTARLILDSRLECGCEEYYLARALREGRVLAALEARCAASDADPPGRSIEGMPLRRVPLPALVCALREEECAANCSCALAPARGGLRVACRGVADLPRLASPLPVARLVARGVRRLPARLPPTLELLDLHDGLIESATPAQAAALFAHGARVRLTRNPLRCDCAARALVDALAAHRSSVLDYENTTCADNRTVAEALASEPCAPRRSWALGALAALSCAALAAGLLAALVARPRARLRLKAYLHARGARWLTRRLEPADAERAFDAFVAHAAGDARFVASELAPALEAGPRPLRLCLYYRDWPIGAWIPTQIEASVRYSRRTIALVTPAFVASRWARASLRAAHAAALRGGAGEGGGGAARVVLVLRGVARAELDAELRALGAAHRTLRWGEPLFWAQLRLALPEPRPLPARAAWPDLPDPAPPAAA